MASFFLKNWGQINIGNAQACQRQKRYGQFVGTRSKATPYAPGTVQTTKATQPPADLRAVPKKLGLPRPLRGALLPLGAGGRRRQRPEVVALQGSQCGGPHRGGPPVGQARPGDEMSGEGSKLSFPNCVENVGSLRRHTSQQRHTQKNRAFWGGLSLGEGVGSRPNTLRQIGGVF